MRGRHLIDDLQASVTSNAAVIDELTPQLIIDGHVHLWPEEMANAQGHAWMKPGMLLAEQRLLSDYHNAAQQETVPPGKTVVEGIVYVETDVRYEKPDGKMPLEVWAKGPLDELRFLRKIVEGEYGEMDASMLLGIVAWAPMDQQATVLEEWLRVAEEVAGNETWMRVKGFRFLLQSILDQRKFEQLVLGERFNENLRLLGKQGYSFDIAVDQRSGGAWQLDAMARAMSRAHDGVPEAEKVIFVIDHLCKPDFMNDGAQYAMWRRGVERMARHERTYMKLSGAFSELPGGIGSAKGIAGHMLPWMRHMLDCYTAKRVLFGSDWPVCNVKRREDSWSAWRDVVQVVLDDENYRLTKEDKKRIWSETAREAYRLD